MAESIDYRKVVKQKEEEQGDLTVRMDEDKDLLHLKEYAMMDAKGKAVPDIVNVTLNRPAVFAANVISALGSTTEQRTVETEDKNLDTDYIEDFQKAAMRSANDRLQLQGRLHINPFFDEQSCIRGRGCARVLFRIGEEGLLIPDITPWDTRYVTYEMGEAGLKWAAYKTKRTKDMIEAEYEYVIEGKTADVIDVWDMEHNEVWIGGEIVFQQPHPYGFTPVVYQIVPLGSMLADEDSLAHQGESIFFLIRHVIPELNRLVSIMQTLNLKSVKPPMVVKVKGSKKVEDPDALTAMATATSVEPDEKIEPINFGDAQRSAQLAYGMLDKAMQEGSLSSFDLGTFTQPMSAIALIEIGEGRDQIFLPRLRTKAWLNEALTEMFTQQVIMLGGTIELGTRGQKRQFQVSKLDGEYETTYQYFVKSPKIDAGRYSLAAAAGNLISERTKRETILQLEDPEGEERQLKYEEAELLSPAIKINRTIEALVEMGKSFEAELMSAEMGVNLEQMLSGETTQEVKPQKEKEPTQVAPMFSGGGATRPQPPPAEQRELE